MDNNFNESFRELPHEKIKRKAALSAATIIPSQEVLLIVGDIAYLTPESLATLKQRGQEWHDLYPLEEPFFSVNGDKDKIDIYPNQVAGLLKIALHIAKHVLRVAQNVLGKDENVNVTVNEFCHLYNINNEETRAVIQFIFPDNRLN